jgi:decaprenylphospho-beta-D-ribofuranose 2-oxidase
MYTYLNSFDGNERIKSIIARPTKYNEIYELCKDKSFIPRGAGLSYCMASGGDDVTSIDTSCFNRIIEFDKNHGTIVVEPGINLGDLLSIIIREGWFLPVLPGYPKITVGGCIGFNVHGKSQYHIGLFGDYVNKLKIFHPNYGEILCTKNENEDIFNLTIGGFGLTGLITEAELKLIPLKSRFVKRKIIHVQNLSETVSYFINHKNEFDIMYSWNNLNDRNAHFGKGFIYMEEFLNSNINVSPNIVKYGNLTSKNRKSLVINFYNNITSKIECKLYGLNETISKKEQVLQVEKASFPINGKEIYFKLFGKKGLREYQMIVPDNNWSAFEEELYKCISLYNVYFTLGSMKLFEGKTNLLNFQKSGICLALDMPATKNAIKFFKELDKLVLKYNGIANLSKDSRIDEPVIKKMYPEFESFKKQINNFEGKFSLNSALRKRLEI